MYGWNIRQLPTCANHHHVSSCQVLPSRQSSHQALCQCWHQWLGLIHKSSLDYLVNSKQPPNQRPRYSHHRWARERKVHPIHAFQDPPASAFNVQRQIQVFIWLSPSLCRRSRQSWSLQHHFSGWRWRCRVNQFQILSVLKVGLKVLRKMELVRYWNHLADRKMKLWPLLNLQTQFFQHLLLQLFGSLSSAARVPLVEREQPLQLQSRSFSFRV